LPAFLSEALGEKDDVKEKISDDQKSIRGLFGVNRFIN
jgi:hypothetical protein